MLNKKENEGWLKRQPFFNSMNRRIKMLVLILWVIAILLVNRFIDNTLYIRYIKAAEFFILYILIYLNFKNLKMCGLRLLLNCLYLSLFISVADESIHSLVSKIEFQVDIVIIEITGSLIAFAVIYLLTRFSKKKDESCEI